MYKLLPYIRLKPAVSRPRYQTVEPYSQSLVPQSMGFATDHQDGHLGSLKDILVDKSETRQTFFRVKLVFECDFEISGFVWLAQGCGGSVGLDNWLVSLYMTGNPGTSSLLPHCLPLTSSLQTQSNQTPNDSFGICSSRGFQNTPHMLDLIKFCLRY